MGRLSLASLAVTVAKMAVIGHLGLAAAACAHTREIPASQLDILTHEPDWGKANWEAKIIPRKIDGWRLFTAGPGSFPARVVPVRGDQVDAAKDAGWTDEEIEFPAQAARLDDVSLWVRDARGREIGVPIDWIDRVEVTDFDPVDVTDRDAKGSLKPPEPDHTTRNVAIVCGSVLGAGAVIAVIFLGRAMAAGSGGTR